MQLWKFHKTPLFLTFVSLFLYYLFAYKLVRTDALMLLSLYIGLFGILYTFVKYTKVKFRFLVTVAIVFRLVFLVAIPNLSQDFYRFIWDGRLLLEGLNPYLHTVESFMYSKQFPINQALELYKGMGELNASHFSNYPPINQLCFGLAALFSGNTILGSVVLMRILIIAADIGTLYFGKKLLQHANLPLKNIFWYILNPFIIIELTGNLHFEGVMIFFLIWSLYLLVKGKWLFAAVVFGLSVSTKLIPLMFLPLFWQWFAQRPLDSARGDNRQPESMVHEKSRALGLKYLFFFYIIIGVTVLITFLPFFNSQFVTNYAQTVGLWFNNFEFNASIYYLAREIGYWFRGYNEIAIIGKVLAAAVFICIVTMAFARKNTPFKNLMPTMLLAITIYLFLGTTIHPWYIATPLILCVFTRFTFPIVWSFAIILSYLAYLGIGTADKFENLWIIALEYSIVYGYFIFEMLNKKTKINPLPQY